MGNTAVRGLPYPEGTDGVDVDDDIEALASALDNVAIFEQGTFVSRPAAGEQGRLYGATDTEVVYYDDGDEWYEIGQFVKEENVAHAFTRDEDTAWPAAGKEVGRFYVSLAADETASLIKVAHSLASGSGSIFKLQRSTGGGSFSDVTGFTGISPSTSLGLTNPDDVALADGDWLKLIITTQGTGKGGAVVPIIKRIR